MTVECEVSRERISLRNAYKAAGQRAALRINSGMERHVAGGYKGERHGGTLGPAGQTAGEAAPQRVWAAGLGDQVGYREFPLALWGRWECCIGGGDKLSPVESDGTSGTRKGLQLAR